jgi:hypothetical protein
LMRPWRSLSKDLSQQEGIPRRGGQSV